MGKGRIKFFNFSRGYGFITGDDGQDYFFAANDLITPISTGAKVEFTIGQSNKGPIAKKVTVI
jgi:cold shock protein